MRKRWIALLAGLALSSGVSAAMPPVKLLIVDAEVVLARSTVAQRLRADATKARETAAGADAREQVDAALDLALSSLLEALPGIIEALAQARGVDAVLEPAVATRIGARGPDLTGEVVAVLDRQSAGLRLELP